MNTCRLLTVEEAAEQLGVPAGSLESAARRHGFIVKMGRAKRIDPDTLGRLIELCRENPPDQGSTGTASARSTTSARADDSSAEAMQIAEKLRRPSRGTSQPRTGPPAQLHRIT